MSSPSGPRADIVRGRTIRLDGQGQGLVELETGPTVSVPGALPGEVVNVRPSRDRRRARGELVEVVEPSADRIEIACSAFGHCGGCKLQHASDSLRLQTIVERARHALQGKIPDYVELEVPKEPAPGAGQRPRTAFRVDRDGGLALPAIGSGSTQKSGLTSIEDCPAADPRAAAVARAIIDEAKKRGVDALEACVVHAAVGTDDVQATLVADTGRLPHAQRLSEAARDAGCTGVGLAPKPEHPSRLVGPRNIPLFGQARLRDSIEGINLRVSPTTFVESNRTAPAQIVEFLREASDGIRTALDLYCGAGLWTYAAAGPGRKVHGVDHARIAIADAEAAGEVEGVTFETQTVVDALNASRGRDIDLLMADPPRGGMKEIAPAIARTVQPLRIVCGGRDPVEFGRDLQQLRELDYEVRRLRLIETDGFNPSVLVLALLEIE